MLIEEAAICAHNMLAPLLARRSPPWDLLHQPLAAIHLGLSSVSKLRAARMDGQAAQRASAARAAAAVSLHLLRGAAAGGAAGGADALATRLAALDYDLLWALAPRPVAAPATAVGKAPDGGDAPADSATSTKGNSKAAKPAAAKAKRAATPPKGKAPDDAGDSRGSTPVPGQGAATSAGTAEEDADLGSKERGSAALAGRDGVGGVPELDAARRAILAHPAGRALGGPVMER